MNKWTIPIANRRIEQYRDERKQLKKSFKLGQIPLEEYRETNAEIGRLLKNATNAKWIMTNRSRDKKRESPKHTVASITRAINKLVRDRRVLKSNTPRGEFKELAGRKISHRLDRYKSTLKRVLAKDSRAAELASKVEEFMDASLKETKCTPKRPAPIHGILMKYGMEHGYVGRRLATHIGITNHRYKKIAASRIRTNFTKTFQTNPENKELYHRFKLFMSS